MFRSTTPASKRLVILLLISLWLQVIEPPVFAAQRGPSPIVSAIGSGSRQLLTKFGVVEQSLISLLRAALTPQETWNVVLAPVTTEFKDYSGLDYHASSRKLLLSAHSHRSINGRTVRVPYLFEADLSGEKLVIGKQYVP